MKKTLLVLLFVLLYGNINAQTPKDYINKFFNIYTEEGFDQAIDSLFTTNKWILMNQESVNSIKTQLSTLTPKLGSYYGYEPLTAQKTGTCYEYYTYLVKYERQPVRFHFAFYEVNGKWILQTFKYEDKIASNLEDSALIDCIINIEQE